MIEGAKAEGAKAVSALNIGSKYRYRRIGVSAKADEKISVSYRP
jgi:hypothetical protein